MKTKRFLSLLLCAVLILTMLPWVIMAEENGDFAGGSGDEADPWEIANWHHLNNVRKYGVEGDENYQTGSYFKLIADLNEATDGYEDYASSSANAGSGWEPIGVYVNWNSTENIHFTGTFDGDGHTISGLFINRPDKNGGLFGYTNNAAIKNLRLVDFDVTGNNNIGGLVGYNDGSIENSYATGDVTGNNNVGGLVGYDIGGTITNSYATGNVEGNNNVGGLVGEILHGGITNSYATGSVNGNSVVGGLVGYNQGGITNSYATGSVNGNTVVGGLVGYDIGGTITNSYATGSVEGNDRVGGLVGFNGGTITNSYATGGVEGSVEGSGAVGGLVGFNSNGGTITNSYAKGSIEGGGVVGGLVGWYFNGPITNCFYDYEATGLGETGVGNGSSVGVTGKTTAEMKQQGTFTGWSFDTIWRIEENKTYPYLAWEPRLATITLSIGSLSPAFNSETLSYTASVANSIGSITVTATPTADHVGADITVNGSAVASGTASSDIALEVGANTITVIVTAQDTNTTEIYTITITREPSSDAALAGLNISTGTLSPVFESGTYTYTATVGNSVTSLPFTPTARDANATITVNGSAVASGTASSDIDLKVGANTITVIVTAQDTNTTEIYTITITREPSSDAVIPDPPKPDSDALIPDPPKPGSDTVIPDTPKPGSDTVIPDPPKPGSDAVIPDPSKPSNDAVISDPPKSGSDAVISDPPKFDSDAAISYPQKGDVKRIIKEYTVTFVDHDGTPLKEEIIKHGQAATAPTGLIREGYTFSGWSADYSNVTDNVIIEALYNINQYTVSFESNGGSTIDSIKADFDSLITAPTAPIKTNHDFAGWYKDSGLTTIWDFNSDRIPSTDITLYGKWIITEYSVPIDDNGHTVTAPAETIKEGNRSSNLLWVGFISGSILLMALFLIIKKRSVQ